MIKKAINVLLSVIILSLLSCASNLKNSDSDFLIENISTEICSIKKDTLLINENADNTSILSLFEEPLYENLYFKKESKDLIEKIFTSENREYIKTQVKVSQWGTELISLIPCEARLIEKKDINAHNKPNLYIAKPVYTKDGQYALVSYVYKSMHSLVIFKKDGDKWQKAEFIPLWLS